ncbi:MAG: hypothetical protein IPK74_04500 [Deltaproteobacteria bacterium]|nr:hypothetical protein [Deltaproteobacteria bacterium]
MKNRMFAAAALLLATTALAVPSAQADDPGLTASKTGKETFCRVRVKVKNALDQTIQLDKIRISSSSDAGFYSEFELSGSRYRPVSGATLPVPTVDVMVPAGHKVASALTYRKQITAGANPKFSQPKSDSWGAGAIQPACSLDGQELLLTVHE